MSFSLVVLKRFNHCIGYGMESPGGELHGYYHGHAIL